MVEQNPEDDGRPGRGETTPGAHRSSEQCLMFLVTDFVMQVFWPNFLFFLLCGLSAAVSGGLLTLWYFSALNDAHDLIYELNTIMVLIWLLLADCRTGNLLS